MGVSLAEAVYGEQLLLPSEWLDWPPASEDDTASLTSKMASFSPTAPICHAWSAVPDATQLPDTLWSSKFVWVRIDRQQSSLAPKYEGPFLVLKQFPKVFLLLKGTEQVAVSTMRLKPAIVTEDFQPQYKG
jgi:hypothetical protein